MESVISYVRERIDLIELNRACKESMYYRKPVRLVNAELYDEVIDLLEEFGEDNDLPEGWWIEDIDIDEDIIKCL